DFMESFIAELEAERVAELEAERVAELSAYLKVSGLDNYELSSDEENAIEQLKTQQISFAEFEFIKIFNNIKQGRRLKKDDQLPGKIPFVMSGTTNMGVIGYISNPVASFPKNSITIDIFGNSFYRNYDFGAGDDTGVYWSTENTYSKASMLFLTTAMECALRGRYSYGKKLRSSQSLHFKMQLPTKDGKPDYDAMSTLISAVQKLVIKDVVLYADRKIEKTKEVINK
ncbi:MAG: restriction endonuclease subunit S, partial [Clostridia bacterium]|nr:restriction endonuclease subunit S [Clostridia bacterium]